MPDLPQYVDIKTEFWASSDCVARICRVLSKSKGLQQMALFEIRTLFNCLAYLRGTASEVGVRRRPLLLGVDRWWVGISVRNWSRACRCRQCSEPAAADRRPVGTNASAVTCSSDGSPGNWPSLQ